MAEQKAFLKQPKVLLWVVPVLGTDSDYRCPFIGTVSIQGSIVAGTCHSAKMMGTIIVRHNCLHFVKKYQGPLSKTVRFNVLENIPTGSSGSGGGKKAFKGI